MESIMPSASTPFGERVQRRLREDVVIWLTTVGADGTPQPNPVWFLWAPESGTILICSLPDAVRVRNIERNPKVSINFDGNGRGGNIVVLTGEAHISPDDPPADQTPAYVEKYAQMIAGSFQNPPNFAAQYSLPIHINITRTHLKKG